MGILKHAIILIHDHGDSLGNLTQGLLAKGISCRYWAPELCVDPPAPATEWDLIVSLGGAANPWETQHRHWQRREIAFLEQAMAHDVPMLSICLGAQLTTLALGGKMLSLPKPEIGLRPLQPLAESWPFHTASKRTLRVFQWHSYGFECPANAKPLARGSAGNCDAYRIGRHVLATQFHLEATTEIFEGWILENLTEIGQSADLLRQALADHGQQMEVAARSVFSAWLGGTDGKAADLVLDHIGSIPTKVPKVSQEYI
ncbi:MAG: hypothetical protein GY762_00590 [Proteobacteria bacterium]|nr:hypothetical protein [Pseudomonadota bacterium]